MSHPAYSVARTVSTKVAEHLKLHRAAVVTDPESPEDLLPDARTIEAIVDAAFWASVRREEGYIPKISLAYLPPLPTVHPLVFAEPLLLGPGTLTRLAAAVERPGVHLGVWRDGDRLSVWGATRSIPAYCFVVEVVEPGLLVLKHRPRHESRKFVNVAVLEGDRMRIVDEQATRVVDCPALLSSMLGFETGARSSDPMNVLVQLAVSMRRHRRGGILLVVPSDGDSWRQSILHPIHYAVAPTFSELAELAAVRHDSVPDHDWLEAIARAIDTVAGLTAVDGATVMTADYAVLAFGAKIARRQSGTPVEEVVVTEPIEGDSPTRVHPGQLGGTRHLSAAQFVRDQRDALALVASQDGRFTIFTGSTALESVHAYRVEVLLL